MPVANWVSTEPHLFLALHHGWWMRDVAFNIYIRSVDRYCRLRHSGSLSCSLGKELCCDSPGGCHGNITCSLTYNRCLLPVPRCLWSFATQIPQHGRPNIVGPQLTIIVKMWQGPCSSFLCVQRQPIQWLYITTTNSLCDYQTYTTKNCCRSVDAHFQDWTGSVLLCCWPIQAASTKLMYNNNLVTV